MLKFACGRNCTNWLWNKFRSSQLNKTRDIILWPIEFITIYARAKNTHIFMCTYLLHVVGNALAAEYCFAKQILKKLRLSESDQNTTPVD